MIAIRMGRRDRRALLVGVAAIAATIVAARGVPAYLAWQREARAAVIELRGSLARAQGLIVRAGPSRDSAIARGHRVIALAPAILSGDTPNSAGATLAGILAGAAAQSGIRLGTVQVRADSLSRDAFTRVGAHMEATGDVRGIIGMLGALEGGPQFIAIRSLSISQPEPAAGDDRVETLHVELDVEGLMLNPRPKVGK
jgi:hypothetical protein